MVGCGGGAAVVAISLAGISGDFFCSERRNFFHVASMRLISVANFDFRGGALTHARTSPRCAITPFVADVSVNDH